MNWVCSACGLENSVVTFVCTECKSGYGKHQNSQITIKLESILRKTKDSFWDNVQPLQSLDISKVDWGRPAQPTVGQSFPIQGVPIPFSIKIASMTVLVCIILSVLLMLR